MSDADIARALGEVRARIDAAARAAGRDSGPADGSVRLVAVSKTKPAAAIAAAAAAGQIDFGENYAQEATEKIAAFPRLRFHFIGALQTNKAKLVVGRATLIHSVDRLKLAREISNLAAKAGGARQDALLQLHIGDEETKSGATLEEALEMARADLPGLRWRGVMSLPPLGANEAESRGYFRQTREAFETIRAALGGADSFNELSMGTTHDFESAIQEGATLVRVGAAIFGARS